MDRVVEGNAGGRLSSERLLNAEFVSERVQLDFPDGEDGEPVITIGKEVLDAMNGLWKQCLIVKVLGRHIAISALSKRLREMWKPKGGMHVMDLPRQFFMIRFELEDEYLAALAGGPWRVFGSYLMTQAWTPEFDPLRDDIVTTPVWIRLSNIPVNFYHKEILMCIAKGLGTPVKVDETTLNFERARFARVCVEVNLSKPLKGSVRINGERYFVAYEGLMNICSGCGIYGHLVHNCPRRLIERTVEQAAPAAPVTRVVERPANDGFTVVGRKGRAATTPVNRIAPASNVSKKDSGRILREIPGNPNQANIEISNRFGDLIEEEISEDCSGVALPTEANKENTFTLANARKGKGIAQGMGNVVFTTGTNNKNGKKFTSKERQTGPSNGGLVIGLKPRQTKLTRPTRGLVFGPIRREEELTASGKRLRVEDNLVGRPGGVFSTERENSNDGTAVNQSQGYEAEKQSAVSTDITQNMEVAMQQDQSALPTAA